MFRFVFLAGALAAAQLLGCSTQDSDPLNDDASTTTDRPAGGVFVESRKIDLPAPDLDQLVEKMVAVYERSSGFQVTGSLWHLGVDADGRPLPQVQAAPKRRRFIVEKPNRISMLPVSENGPTVLSDGQELTMIAPFLDNWYLRETAPDSILEILQNFELQPLGGTAMFFPLHFGIQDLATNLLGSVAEKKFIGAESIDGTPAYHVQMVERSETSPAQEGRWDAWIAAEGPPLILQVRFDVGLHPVEFADGDRRLTPMVVIDRYTDWSIDPQNAADTWNVTLPEKAKETLSFHQARSTLTGQQVAPLSLPMLDGSSVSLSPKPAVEAVVLDFWATWCGPCRVELPLIAKLSQDYAQRGVAIYAVNRQERSELIQEYLKSQKLELNVLLDPHEAAATAFDVRAIPMLVVIDRSGIIRCVHVGFDPLLEPILRKELDRVLAPAEPATP